MLELFSTAVSVDTVSGTLFPTTVGIAVSQSVLWAQPTTQGYIRTKLKQLAATYTSCFAQSEIAATLIFVVSV